MSSPPDTTEQVQRLLISEAGFHSELIERDYRFAHRQRIPLAGFAYRPLDARSACIGVATAGASSRDVSTYRGLGAPLLIVETDRTFDLWRVATSEENDRRIAGNLTLDGLRGFFRQKPEILRPHRIYEAKTVARVEKAQKQLDLFAEFVDPDLLPFVEGDIGQRLTSTVVAGIRQLVEEFGPDEWLIKAVFRLMAGKVLRDKGVPGFKSLTLSNVADVLKKVERHYGSVDPLRLNKRKSAALQQVMSQIQQLGDLRNLTTESLGDVYEQALITKDIRRIHGTHKTPGYLVDYVVWQLAKWIEEIPVDDLQFFEPGCGHAPFLVSLMRLLRALDVGVSELSPFFRERFSGVDNDPFALEIARLSLTLADEPNPDGWHGLSFGDMFEVGFLEQAAANSTVMLTNPPYESRKAEELLFRTLPHLPVGAVFGAVVPATLLFSDKPRAISLREWMIESCQLAEIDLFPDGLFTFGDHECAVLLGRVLHRGSATKSLQSRLRRVRDTDAARKAFQLDYQFSTTRLSAQGDLRQNADCALWTAEFQTEIWSYLRNNPRLSSIADVNQGLQHKGRGKPEGAKTVEDEHFPGSRLGFASSTGSWEIHEHPPMKYFNLAEEVIRRPGTGTDCVPQVLLNYGPVGRGPWRLKPFIDGEGRAFTSRFLSVRPVGGGDLFYIWALLISPLANLFANTHLLKRDITKGVIDTLPVPIADIAAEANIQLLARKYIETAQAGKRDMFNADGYSESELTSLLVAIDTEVLRLYRLPAKSERLLLEQFRGHQRPGVPVAFKEFYPADTPDVPLYAFHSRSYQRALAGESPELAETDRLRYEALSAKSHDGKLTRREAERLHALQAEVDGRDYAMLDSRMTDAASEIQLPDEFEQRLRALSDRAASSLFSRGQE